MIKSILHRLIPILLSVPSSALAVGVEGTGSRELGSRCERFFLSASAPLSPRSSSEVYRGAWDLFGTLAIDKGSVAERYSPLHSAAVQLYQATQAFPLASSKATARPHAELLLAKLSMIVERLDAWIPTVDSKAMRHQAHVLREGATRLIEHVAMIAQKTPAELTNQEIRELETRIITYYGFIGERAVAFTLPDLQYVGVSIPGLLKKQYPEIESPLLAQFTSSERSSEIDIVFKNGRAWGEVKVRRDVVGEDSERWSAFYEQLVRIARLRRYFNAHLPPEKKIEELHLFISHGVTPGARAEIEKLGFEIHQPDVLAIRRK